MQKLRNLRLAVRLGVAFGALALGCSSSPSSRSSRRTTSSTKVDALAVDVPQYTALVDGIAARLPEEAHLPVEHLYVHDGDLRPRTRSPASSRSSPEADEAAFAAHGRGARPPPATPRRVQAVDGVKQLQSRLRRATSTAVAQGDRGSRASETVDGVEERVGRARSTLEQIVPTHEALEAAWPRAPRATLTYAAGEGEKAARRDRGDEALDPDRRAPQRARRARARGPHHALGHAPGARLQQRLESLNDHCLDGARRPASRPAPTAT